jgi:hypothetical protein
MAERPGFLMQWSAEHKPARSASSPTGISVDRHPPACIPSSAVVMLRYAMFVTALLYMLQSLGCEVVMVEWGKFGNATLRKTPKTFFYSRPRGRN